jgi:hypothetical protein
MRTVEEKNNELDEVQYHDGKEIPRLEEMDG